MKNSFFSRALSAAIRPFLDKTLAILGILFILGTAWALRHLFDLSTRMMETTALQGTIILSQSIQEFRSLYTSEVVDRALSSGMKATHDYDKKKGAIPLPATLSIELGRRVGARGSGMRVLLYSDYPFRWRPTFSPNDSFAREAIDYLRKNPSKSFHRFEDVDGQPTLRYATAEVMQPQCVQCHNAHPDSPKRDWKVGDVRGILEVTRPIAPVVVQTRKDMKNTYILVGGAIMTSFGALLLLAFQLHRQSRKLEKQVSLRTKELQLVNKELESFNYSVSHDLRNPITVINAYSLLLLDKYSGNLDEQGKLFLRRIGFSAGRMTQMIRGLLNLSRAVSGPLKKETVDLSALAASIAEELKTLNPERAVEFAIAPGLKAHCDPNLMYIALENLINNSWKYTGKKTDALIEFGHSVADGEDAFFVRDNGAGFDMSRAQNLFGVFQRFHSEKEFSGTGIGLGTVARIIKRHGGRVWAESAPGEGATFYFKV